MTVGIVALPLAMAFAIASGLKPEAGIWTAIIAGSLISALGGSAVQIGGPAGAFIVVVYSILERYGLANLLISTACAGVLLFMLGFLKLGTLVRYVPVSIVVGFTNGIAVLIVLSQIKDLLGLAVPKAVGTAVVRNRIKRRLRELFRERSADLPSDHDYVLVVRPGLPETAESRGFDWLGERVDEILGKAAA